GAVEVGRGIDGTAGAPGSGVLHRVRRRGRGVRAEEGVAAAGRPRRRRLGHAGWGTSWAAISRYALAPFDDDAWRRIVQPWVGASATLTDLGTGGWMTASP